MLKSEVISLQVDEIKKRINEAAERSGQDSDRVQIIAVTKFVGPERIGEAVGAGINILGENRVQEFIKKYPLVEGPVQWHLIGSLQTNKVKSVIDKVELIHSLDRDSLALEISRQAQRFGRPVKALVQVNVSGESTKRGLATDELFPFIKKVTQLDGLLIKGLMTIAPLGDPESIRPVFRTLRHLYENLAEKDLPGVQMEYLSMGMTNDFEIAVEEGANLIRIGTGIFGGR
ncbi:MAG: YggS family pyridoxal phosphate-dependent enzyme [Syntrophomonadaceae bacterium]|nr:YggS family pyridoxal phosphate-dependent enzyme [Syntrophomonadaceae bacterium]